MTNPWQKLKEGDTFDDSTVKNRFNWSWLEGSVEEGGEKYSAWARKVVKPGYCVCERCNNCPVKYGSNGKKVFSNHANTKRHKDATESSRATQSVPGTQPNTSLQQRVALHDRVLRMEALVITWLAENQIPLSKTPGLIKLMQAAARDPCALKKVGLKSANTAGYKLREGLGTFWESELADKLKKCQFSVTIDESTSESNQRVLAILVRYWDVEVNQLAVQHLRSVELFKVDAESVCNAVTNTFQSLSIPLENVVSVYMDNCATMRGIKSGKLF